MSKARDLLGRPAFVKGSLWDDMQDDCGPIHASRLGNERWERTDHQVFIGGPKDSFGSSDYSGHIYNLANRRFFMEEFEETCGKLWWPLIGDHSYTDICFIEEALDDEHIREALEGLVDYALLNDDTWEVEQEIADEGWDSYGRREFVDWLREYREVPDDITEDEWEAKIDSLTKAQVDDLWWETVRNGRGEEVTFEYLTARFNFDDAFENIDVFERILEMPVPWGELLRDRITERTFVFKTDIPGEKALASRAQTLPLPLWDALYAYLAERSGTPEADDPLHPEHALDAILIPTREWPIEKWLVLFDTLEEDGIDALKPGGRGRALGRR